MASGIQSKLLRLRKSIRALPQLGFGSASYLVERGWFETFRQRKSLGAGGEPVPWYTYPAAAFIGERLSKSMSVFEYGSGNSTLWYAARVGSIIACEHDKNWAEVTIRLLPENACIFEAPLDDTYVAQIAKASKLFDIIVIDGRMRNKCAAYATEFLKPDGVIIWDNSEREKYQSGIKGLTSKGFRRIDFSGMGPINVYGWTTSIFYRPENVLGI